MDSVKTVGRCVPAISDEMIEAGERALSDVIWQFRYVMPIDGMRRVLKAALAASPPAGAEVMARAKEIIANGCGCDRDCERNGEGYCGCLSDAQSVLALAAPLTPSTDAARRQAREEALEEAARDLDAIWAAYRKSADVVFDLDVPDAAAKSAAINGIADVVAECAAAVRARALSTPPAGADEGGKNGG